MMKACAFLSVAFTSLLSLIASHTWKNNAIFQISRSFASSGNLCDCWVFHHSPMGNFKENSHPTAIPIIHFTNVPKYTITFKKEPSDDLPGSDTEFPSHPTHHPAPFLSPINYSLLTYDSNDRNQTNPHKILGGLPTSHSYLQARYTTNQTPTQSPLR